MRALEYHALYPDDDKECRVRSDSNRERCEDRLKKNGLNSSERLHIAAAVGTSRHAAHHAAADAKSTSKIGAVRNVLRVEAQRSAPVESAERKTSMKRRSGIIVMLVLFIAGVATWTSAQLSVIPVTPPHYMSGDNFGFRVEGTRGDRVVGRLVVRIDGKWVEAELTGEVRRLTSR
jgi:hypothetical protein